MLGLFQSRKQAREISPSRLMLYYGAREIEGSTGADEGAYIRDIFKAWSKVGVAPEPMWPYDESKVTARPSSEAYAEGKKTLAVSYHALDNTDLSELKTCLAMGHPFELGFTVYRQFMYGNWKDTMPMPVKNEQILGGHAVTAVGYDDARQAFRIKNSWGNDWKDNGHFWMPYAFITNPGYCDDFWMLDGVTPAETPAPTPDKITSIVDLKKIFTAKRWINCLRENEIVAIGKEMGLNTDLSKTKAQNVAIVSGGLGL
jgi:C1A family cysteine protease